MVIGRIFHKFPQEYAFGIPHRLETAPTELGTAKLTHKVRLQTAPTGNGEN